MIEVELQFTVWRKPSVRLTDPIGGNHIMAPVGTYHHGQKITWQATTAAWTVPSDITLTITTDARGWKFWSPNPLTYVVRMHDVVAATAPGGEVDL